MKCPSCAQEQELSEPIAPLSFIMTQCSNCQTVFAISCGIIIILDKYEMDAAIEQGMLTQYFYSSFRDAFEPLIKKIADSAAHSLIEKEFNPKNNSAHVLDKLQKTLEAMDIDTFNEYIKDLSEG